MSNIKQALESAIEWIERYADRHGYHTDGLLLINKLKISLDELEKCEPVAYLKFISRQWLVSPEIGMDGFEGFEVCDKYGKGDDGADAFAVYTSPQPIEKCEPVALVALNNAALQKRIDVLEDLLTSAAAIAIRNGEGTHWERFIGQLKVNGIGSITAKTFRVLPSDEGYTSPISKEREPVAEAIRERDRLGFAVVNVIGKLDEIIENTQEVEIDDFLHIAVPIDMWNELQAALEDMPKRADLYTSPQPIEKCEPYCEVKTGYPSAVHWLRINDLPDGTQLYTSPISKEWVGLSDGEKLEILENNDWYNSPQDLIKATEAKLKKLNAPEKG